MRNGTALLVLTLLGVLVPHGAAQEKAKTEEKTNPATTLKVQIVMSEYDGDRKVGSLPYALLVGIPAGNSSTLGISSIRMGVRVPVVSGMPSKDGAAQFQYLDVGTNIDCRARVSEPGLFDLNLTIERSSVYSNAAVSDEKTAHAVSEDVRVSKDQPLIRQFRTGLNILLKDGQTAESVMSTDPVSGRVLRLTVTLGVVK